MDPANLHATVVVVGATGVLIRGASGAGKSALALQLIEASRARGRFATLVADDRVWLSVLHGRPIARVPEPIAGLVEIRGYGPAPVAHEPSCVVDRIVALVEPAAAPRFREDAGADLCGVSLPRLDLAERDCAGGARAILAWLDADEPPAHSAHAVGEATAT